MSFPNLCRVVEDDEFVDRAVYGAKALSPNPPVDLIFAFMIRDMNARLKNLEHMSMKGMGKDQFPHPDCIGHFCKWGIHHVDDDEAKSCNQRNPNQSCV